MELMDHPEDKYTLRSAYQWLAMITMTMDHVGYLYSYYLLDLRYFGRLGMPFYALLFVMTARSGHVNFKRLLFIALLSQLPCMYIFEGYALKTLLETPFSAWTFENLKFIQLNIIFGFAIFAWTVIGIQKRAPLRIISGFMMMIIPIVCSLFPGDHGWYRYATLFQVDYGWYLYATLFIFWGLRNKILQVVVFTCVTYVYTLGYWSLTGMGIVLPGWICIFLQDLYWRQMLAVISPMITGVKAVRPNKYLYRYFYPGHLMILAAFRYFQLFMPDWYWY